MPTEPLTETLSELSCPAPSQLLQVRVRLFAALREAAGWGERRLQVSAGATPGSLWRQLQLADAWPSPTGELPPGLRVAINQRFAAADTALADGDELAFLPPISGG